MAELAQNLTDKALAGTPLTEEEALAVLQARGA